MHILSLIFPHLDKAILYKTQIQVLGIDTWLQYIFLLNHSLFISNIQDVKPQVEVVESEAVTILPCV